MLSLFNDNLLRLGEGGFCLSYSSEPTYDYVVISFITLLIFNELSWTNDLSISDYSVFLLPECAWLDPFRDWSSLIKSTSKFFGVAECGTNYDLL